MLRFAHLEFQVFIGQVLGLSVNSLELTKTHCLLNGVLDVSLGFIVLINLYTCAKFGPDRSRGLEAFPYL